MANEMVRWTISSDERPKPGEGRECGNGTSLAALGEGQAFLASLPLVKKS
jgi:hypothetical protein